MSAASPAPTLTPELRGLAAMLATHLCMILAGLAATVAARLYRAPWHGYLALPLWLRLTRLPRRFNRVMDDVASSRPAPRSGGRSNGTKWKPPFPGGRAWLVQLLPDDVAVYGHRLRYLLAEPGMAELLAIAPRAVRLLRPLCHMLGVPETSLPPRPPRLPAKPRPPRPRKPPVSAFRPGPIADFAAQRPPPARNRTKPA